MVNSHIIKTVIKYTAALGLLASMIGAIGHYSEINRQFLRRSEDYHLLMNELMRQSKNFNGETAIYVKDLATGKTIGINTDQRFPSASLVKVPIMAVVYQAQKEGLLTLDDTLKLRQSHKVFSRRGLYRARSGRSYTIRELVDAMIITSDNTATNMLVERLGFGYINQKFVEFGLKDTDLRRGIMELKWRKLGIDNYTTAQDMAMLLEKIYTKELVSESSSEEMLSILWRQRINDRIPARLPEYCSVAHKTGSLNDTISDVGIVFTPQGDFVLCVLTLDGKTWKTAKRFIGQIASSAFQYCYQKS